MEDVKCPNCKGVTEQISSGGFDYIKCPECGCFKVQPDKTFTVCDPPAALEPDPAVLEPDPAALEPEPASTNNVPVSLPGDELYQKTPLSPTSPGKPEPKDDDDDDVTIRVNIKIED